MKLATAGVLLVAVSSTVVKSEERDAAERLEAYRACAVQNDARLSAQYRSGYSDPADTQRVRIDRNKSGYLIIAYVDYYDDNVSMETPQFSEGMICQASFDAQLGWTGKLNP